MCVNLDTDYGIAPIVDNVEESLDVVLLGTVYHSVQTRDTISSIVEIRACAVEQLAKDSIRARIRTYTSKAPNPGHLELNLIAMSERSSFPKPLERTVLIVERV